MDLSASKQAHLAKIRANSAYPLFRAFLGIFTTFGYLIAGVPILIGLYALMTGDLTVDSSMMLIILATLIGLLVFIAKDLALMVVDMADTMVDCSLKPPVSVPSTSVPEPQPAPIPVAPVAEAAVAPAAPITTAIAAPVAEEPEVRDETIPIPVLTDSVQPSTAVPVRSTENHVTMASYAYGNQPKFPVGMAIFSVGLLVLLILAGIYKWTTHKTVATQATATSTAAIPNPNPAPRSEIQKPVPTPAQEPISAPQTTAASTSGDSLEIQLPKALENKAEITACTRQDNLTCTFLNKTKEAIDLQAYQVAGYDANGVKLGEGNLTGILVPSASVQIDLDFAGGNRATKFVFSLHE